MSVIFHLSDCAEFPARQASAENQFGRPGQRTNTHKQTQTQTTKLTPQLQRSSCDDEATATATSDGKCFSILWKHGLIYKLKLRLGEHRTHGSKISPIRLPGTSFSLFFFFFCFFTRSAVAAQSTSTLGRRKTVSYAIFLDGLHLIRTRTGLSFYLALFGAIFNAYLRDYSNNFRGQDSPCFICSSVVRIGSVARCRY